MAASSGGGCDWWPVVVAGSGYNRRQREEVGVQWQWLTVADSGWQWLAVTVAGGDGGWR